MDELLKASQGVLDSWYEFRNEMTLQMHLSDLRDAIADLRTEVTIQRNRQATDEIVERVEQR